MKLALHQHSMQIVTPLERQRELFLSHTSNYSAAAFFQMESLSWKIDFNFPKAEQPNSFVDCCSEISQ